MRGSKFWTKRNVKMLAYNWRFGASGGVARLKVCANLQVLRPSERQLTPACAKPLPR